MIKLQNLILKAKQANVDWSKFINRINLEGGFLKHNQVMHSNDLIYKKTPVHPEMQHSYMEDYTKLERPQLLERVNKIHGVKNYINNAKNNVNQNIKKQLSTPVTENEIGDYFHKTSPVTHVINIEQDTQKIFPGSVQSKVFESAVNDIKKNPEDVKKLNTYKKITDTSRAHREIEQRKSKLITDKGNNKLFENNLMRDTLNKFGLHVGYQN